LFVACFRYRFTGRVARRQDTGARPAPAGATVGDVLVEKAGSPTHTVWLSIVTDDPDGEAVPKAADSRFLMEFPSSQIIPDDVE
jgi:hypothetical protein